MPREGRQSASKRTDGRVSECCVYDGLVRRRGEPLDGVQLEAIGRRRPGYGGEGQLPVSGNPYQRADEDRDRGGGLLVPLRVEPDGGPFLHRGLVDAAVVLPLRQEERLHGF